MNRKSSFFIYQLHLGDCYNSRIGQVRLIGAGINFMNVLKIYRFILLPERVVLLSTNPNQSSTYPAPHNKQMFIMATKTVFIYVIILLMSIVIRFELY